MNVTITIIGNAIIIMTSIITRYVPNLAIPMIISIIITAVTVVTVIIISIMIRYACRDMRAVIRVL